MLIYGLPSALIFAAAMGGVFAAYEGVASVVGALWMFGLGGLGFGFFNTLAIWVGSEEDYHFTTANRAEQTSDLSTPPV
jgi:hypothetical protein